MNYSLNVENGNAIEILTVNGKKYKRVWGCSENGIVLSDSGNFDERLEDDGCDEEELLDKVYNVLDTNFFVSDVMDLCSMGFK